MSSTVFKSATTPASSTCTAASVTNSDSRGGNTSSDTKSSELGHANSDVIYYTNGVKTRLGIATGDTFFATAVYPGSSMNCKLGAQEELVLAEKELTNDLLRIHGKTWEKVENGPGRATVDKLNTEMNDVLSEQEESSSGLFGRYSDWKIVQVDDTSSFNDLYDLNEQVKRYNHTLKSENGVLLIPKPKSTSTAGSGIRTKNHISASRVKLWKRQSSDESNESKIDWSQCKSFIVPHPGMTCSIDESQRRIAALHQRLSNMTFPSKVSEDEIIQKVQNQIESDRHHGIGFKLVDEKTLDISCLRPIVEL